MERKKFILLCEELKNLIEEENALIPKVNKTMPGGSRIYGSRGGANLQLYDGCPYEESNGKGGMTKESRSAWFAWLRDATDQFSKSTAAERAALANLKIEMLDEAKERGYISPKGASSLAETFYAAYDPKTVENRKKGLAKWRAKTPAEKKEEKMEKAAWKIYAPRVPDYLMDFSQERYPSNALPPRRPKGNPNFRRRH